MSDSTTTEPTISRQRRMEAPRAISIDLQSPTDRLTVERRKFDVRHQAGDVADYNQRFIQMLEDIRRDIDEETLALPDALYDDYMQGLREIGAEAYAMLPNGARDFIRELELDEGKRGISLDFTFPSGMDFLWEMMCPDYQLGAEANKNFWGFHYPIGHLYWESNLKSSIKLQNGVLASTHDKLPCSIEELKKISESLKEIQTHLNREVTFLKVDDVVPSERLSSDKVFEYFNGGDFGYGVVHFACHCNNPTDAGASQAYLLLTVHQKELNLTLGKFNLLANKGFKNQPLVFLNACESMTPLHFLQSLNFPSSLVNFGAGCVIATACTMPDRFASAFAGEFYRRLLTKPLSNIPAYISGTLLETRLHFLEKKNPLGLAYGLFSISNQQFILE